MTEMLAIIGNTWRLSRRQVVFIIMLVIMTLLALTFVILPKQFEEDGEKKLGIIFMDEPIDGFEEGWNQTYLQVQYLSEGKTKADLQREGMQDMSMEERSKKIEEMARKHEETIAAATGLTKYERSVQFWLYLADLFTITIAMYFFIAACAGYFPGLMSRGAIDVVVAKPLHRFKIFLGQYIGGMVLFSLAILSFHLIVFLGVGAKTGVWHVRFFAGVPFQIFLAATLYAILALLGILSRGPLLPIILGYVFYLIIDSAFGMLIGAQRMGALEKWPWLDSTVVILRKVIPNFSLLKDWSVLTVLDIPSIHWEPFIVGGSWLVASLGLGYWIFHRRDF